MSKDHLFFKNTTECEPNNHWLHKRMIRRNNRLFHKSHGKKILGSGDVLLECDDLDARQFENVHSDSEHDYDERFFCLILYEGGPESCLKQYYKFKHKKYVPHYVINHSGIYIEDHEFYTIGRGQHLYDVMNLDDIDNVEAVKQIIINYPGKKQRESIYHYNFTRFTKLEVVRIIPGYNYCLELPNTIKRISLGRKTKIQSLYIVDYDDNSKFKIDSTKIFNPSISYSYQDWCLDNIMSAERYVTYDEAINYLTIIKNPIKSATTYK